MRAMKYLPLRSALFSFPGLLFKSVILGTVECHFMLQRASPHLRWAACGVTRCALETREEENKTKKKTRRFWPISKIWFMTKIAETVSKTYSSVAWWTQCMVETLCKQLGDGQRHVRSSACVVIEVKLHSLLFLCSYTRCSLAPLTAPCFFHWILI